MRRFDARTVAALTASVVVLATAFVAAPATLSGGSRDVPREVRAGFGDTWRSGGADLTPAMRDLAGYWMRYHTAKAVLAALLLGVLVALGTRLWRRYAESTRHRVAVAAGGVLASGSAVGALAVVLANVQGAAAPFASLLPMLVDGPPDPALAGTVEEILGQLRAGGPASPALGRIIDDYALYHWVIAALAGAVAVGLLALGAVLWRRSRAAGPARRVLLAHGVLSVVVAALLAVVVVANVGTAADPVPGLIGFFEGGW
jgi:hypothetical protein